MRRWTRAASCFRHAPEVSWHYVQVDQIKCIGNGRVKFSEYYRDRKTSTFHLSNAQRTYGQSSNYTSQINAQRADIIDICQLWRQRYRPSIYNL